MRAIYFLLLLIIFLCFTSVASAQEYTIPVMALSNSPADNVKNYFGNKPQAPTTGANINKVFFPAAGNVWGVEIYDYSAQAGTAEAYGYYLIINNTDRYLIQNQSVNTNERVFTNFSIRNIPVSLGNYFEIMRQHPANWVTNPLLNSVGGYVFVNATVNGYAIPMQALSSSPADSVPNYMGFRPIAPSTAQGTNKFYVPADGNITSAFIYDNSSGTQPGTNEAVSYFLQINGGKIVLIDTESIGNNSVGGDPNSTAPERIFGNTNLNTRVNRGDYVEWVRQNPVWAVNPLTNIVSGLAFVNTVSSRDPQGYKLHVQALTSSPADAATVYFGQSPMAPNTTANRNKVYIRQGGTINHVEIYVYSGTAGTAEEWSMYLRLNNAQDYLVSTANSSAAERLFKNQTMGITVAAGDYFEMKGVQPTWQTNPATTIYGGYVYIEETTAACQGDVVLPYVADFSANLTPASNPAIVQFFDQSNNTIPGTTTYKWNFTDGGVTVDSTSKDPTFTYTAPGIYTINHTINGGSSSSIISKTLTITGSSATAPPNASFVITLTDTSTNVPSSWQWNATNLTGDNIERTFSTAQNPIWNFTKAGNYRINLTATNAFGSNTTNQTVFGWNLTSPLVHFWSRTA